MKGASPEGRVGFLGERQGRWQRQDQAGDLRGTGGL